MRDVVITDNDGAGVQTYESTLNLDRVKIGKNSGLGMRLENGTTGSVSNLLVNDNGKLKGYNTDYAGAIKALKEVTELRGRKVLVLGAGGAAKAIVYGLTKQGATVTVANRTYDKALALGKKFGCKGIELEDIAPNIFDVIINATSVGMLDGGCLIENIPPGKIVMDVIYKKTKLLERAEASGCKIVTGQRMLLHQAVFQFQLWTGVEPDFEIMEQAIR